MIFTEETASLSSSKNPNAKPLILLLLGPPGAGKGTHATPLHKTLQIPHVSTGDLFREHIREKTSLGKLAKDYIDKGLLVPDKLVLDMLFMRIEKEDCRRGFILDGFPRTLPQGEALHEKFAETHQIKVFNFSLSDSCLVERITGRIVCKKCGAPYHRKKSPPQVENLCDLCQSALYQRDDDTEEVFLKRLDVYKEQTAPLIEFYLKKKGTLFKITADQSKERVFEEVLNNLKLIGSHE
jgi:adenylate kinase